jgi:hypothetical protein
MSTRKHLFPSAQDVTNETLNDFDYFDLEKSIVIESNRDVGEEVLVVIDDDEVMEIVFDDETIWVGRAGDIPEMLQDPQSRSDDRDGNEVFTFPSRLETFNEDRGLIDNIGIKIVKFFKKKATKKVTEIAVKQIAKKIDRKIQPNPGLYLVDNQFRLKKVNKVLPATAAPYCLFLHGTASDFEGSFGKMTGGEEDPMWGEIRATYDGRILTLEHYTFSKSPFENLCDLLELLPENSDLHVVSHSRGGLIGELLAHYHSSNKVVGFQDETRTLVESIVSAEVLSKLDDLTQLREITIGKFIRVACPAQGTTIITKRTDHFLNALFGGLQLALPAAAPLLVPLKELIALVVAQKENPKALPGIEVMNPFSDFQRLINSPLNPVAAPLTIVAGNGKMGLSPKGFLSVLTKLYFFGNNDWVVDTKYMLRGKPRETDPYFCIDSRVSVNHFSYFKNLLTQERMIAAIQAPKGEIPEGFKRLLDGEISDADRDLLVGKYTGKKLSEIESDKPVMIIVPGILGSNLELNGKEIFLNIPRIAAGQMTKLTMDQPNVVASSVLGFAYKKFGKKSNKQYQVMTFAFDWRKSLEDEGARLKILVQALLQKVTNQPIVFAAHSQGGLVVRELMLDTAIWKDLQARKNFKCVFFGSPLGGSYLIPEELVGEGKRIKQLAMIDLPNEGDDLLKVFSTYTGLLQLLPVDGKFDFGQLKAWDWMKENCETNWTIPSKKDINAFDQFRNRILTAGESIYDSPDVIYVAGKADATLDGMVSASRRRQGKRLEFTSTPRGDGSVTWDSGIPRVLLQRNQVYYVDVSHGALLSKTHIFEGIYDLFGQGRTTNKYFSQTEIKGAKKGFLGLYRDEALLPATELNLGSVLMGGDFFGPDEPYENLKEITVSIAAGHLDFSKYPVMIGHLWNDGIVHAEAALDDKLHTALSRSHTLKNYPELIGDNQVFRVKGAIEAVIVGLGKPEDLSAKQLEETLLRGMLKYLLEVQNGAMSDAPVGCGLSVLFIGTGYIGMTLETSIKSILNAAHKANQILEKEGIMGAVLDKIQFIELYDDKAKNARKILNRVARLPEFNFRINHPEILREPGIMKRILEEQDSSWWKRLNIAEMDVCNKNDSEDINLEFTISSGKAHSEKHTLSMPKNNIEALIHRVSAGKQWDEVSAKVIFEFLIPAGLKEEIRLKQNMLLLVDEKTASYPWEMIQDELEDTQPICTEVGMIRQLSTPSSDRVMNHVKANKVLIVGDPNTGGMVSQLPGAEAEAKEVNSLFEKEQYDTVPIISEGHSRIMNALFADKYKYVHLAGHGFYDPEKPNASGMAIGKEVFLTPAMIKQLPFTPDFVFVNCCHLGFIQEEDERYQNHRSSFGANFGVELIKSGVKALIVAGWAVNDGAAKIFAQVFYREMFAGKRFGEAVLSARQTCYARYGGTNTWGAYQCYGDYNFKFTEKKSEKYTVKPKQYVFEEEIIIDLENELAKADTRNVAVHQLARFKSIETGMEAYCASLDAPPATPKMYELLAQTYLEYRYDEQAERVFNKVFTYEQGAFSIRSVELYALFQKKVITTKLMGLEPKEALGHSDIDVLLDGITRMEKIGHGQESAERQNLIAGNYKVLAAVRECLGESGVNDALRLALIHYSNGYNQVQHQLNEVMFPLTNRVSLEVVLIERKSQPSLRNQDQIRTHLSAILENLVSESIKSDEAYNHWPAMVQTKLRLCEMLLSPSIQTYTALIAVSEAARGKGGSVKKWSSEKEHIGVLLSLLERNSIVKEQLTKYAEWLSLR